MHAATIARIVRALERHAIPATNALPAGYQGDHWLATPEGVVIVECNADRAPEAWICTDVAACMAYLGY